MLSRRTNLYKIQIDLSGRLLPKAYTDTEPLPHWEDIIGLFSTTDGEILRFLLLAKIPLEKLIRHELACRGYDENHRWVGFNKAHEIWKTTE